MDLSAYKAAPFRPNGRGPGFDCWGLIWAIYRDQLGIDLPSYDEDYFGVKDRRIAGLVAEESRKWCRVTPETAGDIILLRLNRYHRHVGLVVEPGQMIHVLEGAWVVIESYRDPLWKNRIQGFYRHDTAYG